MNTKPQYFVGDTEPWKIIWINFRLLAPETGHRQPIILFSLSPLHYARTLCTNCTLCMHLRKISHICQQHSDKYSCFCFSNGNHCYKDSLWGMVSGGSQDLLLDGQFPERALDSPAVHMSLPFGLIHAVLLVHQPEDLLPVLQNVFLPLPWERNNFLWYPVF